MERAVSPESSCRSEPPKLQCPTISPSPSTVSTTLDTALPDVFGHHEDRVLKAHPAGLPDQVSNGEGRQAGSGNTPVVHNNNKSQVIQPLGLKFFVAAFTASLTGFIVGYDLGCVAVVLNPVQTAFQLCGSTFTCPEKSMFIALISPGAALGGVTGGLLADAFGRRAALVFSDMLVFSAGLLISLGEIFAMLLVGRFLLGLGAGIGFVVFAAYISEITPESIRGALVASQEILQVIGCLAAYAAAWGVGAEQWRPLTGVIACLGLLQLACLLLFLPESPRWLVQRGMLRNAEASLRRLGTKRADAEAHVLSLQQQTAHQAPPGIAQFLHQIRSGLSSHRRVLALAVACAFAHVATGANTVQYFVVDIFQFGGICDTRAPDLAVGVAKMLGVVACVALADSWGRRPLLILGVTGSCLSHLFSSISFAWLQATRGKLSGMCLPDDTTGGLSNLATPSYLILGSILGYIFFWSIGWACLMLVVSSEILPTCVRGLGIGFTTMTFSLLVFILQSSLEPLFGVATPAGTFGILWFTSVFSLLFIVVAVPEGKGRSLEDVQREQETYSKEVDRHFARGKIGGAGSSGEHRRPASQDVVVAK
ncbi:sugar transporter st1 [Cystoisospora suis]|uniref:Hexose transporter 1 n=1 Tax=Cystoisospora suis TaxID=483139 RepID=A0A2C6L4R4_9APIC|nr:sugar transporter st1 [Cystoisospora suis]